MIPYAALMLLSLWFNRGDGKLLWLTAVVAASFFLDVPRSSQLAFYGTCIAVEVGVAWAAYALKTRASPLVIELCAVMVIAHIMGWSIDGHSSTSMYKVIMWTAEYSQILVCLIAAQPAVSRLKNHESSSA